VISDRKPAEDGPCQGEGGEHWDAHTKRGKHKGSLVKCPCCTEEDGKAKVDARWRWFD